MPEQLLRCHICGDSRKNEAKGHLSLNLVSGLYYCYRCGSGGVYSSTDIFELLMAEDGGMPLEDKSPPKKVPLLVPTIVSRRYSNISPRYSAVFPSADVFPSRDVDGNILGWHGRFVGASRLKAYTWGKRMFGYSGASLLPASLLRVVEGPYDVLSDEDVCVYGTPTKAHAEALRGLELVLCPDSDVWEEDVKLYRWLIPFEECLVKCVERLPYGDPEDVPEEGRQRVNYRRLLGELKKGLR